MTRGRVACELVPTADRPKGSTVVFPVGVSLRDLCKGATLQRKLSRRRFRPDGELADDAVVLDLKIKAGHKAGTRLVFENQGDESSAHSAGDVVFVVTELPHPTLSRVRHGCPDIVARPVLPAKKEAHNHTVQLPDGSSAVVVLIPKLTATITLEGRGMPVLKKGKIVRHGDVIVMPTWR
eukprot:Rhum_TRINITY_DN4598_c0_g3::Rhum_TRINITY_DN4598_c0_g3_i1::g.14970::m.14970